MVTSVSANYGSPGAYSEARDMALYNTASGSRRQMEKTAMASNGNKSDTVTISGSSSMLQNRNDRLDNQGTAPVQPGQATEKSNAVAGAKVKYAEVIAGTHGASR